MVEVSKANPATVVTSPPPAAAPAPADPPPEVSYVGRKMKLRDQKFEPAPKFQNDVPGYRSPGSSISSESSKSTFNDLVARFEPRHSASALLKDVARAEQEELPLKRRSTAADASLPTVEPSEDAIETVPTFQPPLHAPVNIELRSEQESDFEYDIKPEAAHIQPTVRNLVAAPTDLESEGLRHEMDELIAAIGGQDETVKPNLEMMLAKEPQGTPAHTMISNTISLITRLNAAPALKGRVDEAIAKRASQIATDGYPDLDLKGLQGEVGSLRVDLQTLKSLRFGEYTESLISGYNKKLIETRGKTEDQAKEVVDHFEAFCEIMRRAAADGSLTRENEVLAIHDMVRIFDRAIDYKHGNLDDTQYTVRLFRNNFIGLHLGDARDQYTEAMERDETT